MVATPVTGIQQYPPVGSRWEMTIGPDVPRAVFKVVYSGHGTVALKQDDGGHCTISIGVLTWHRGPYNPVAVPQRGGARPGAGRPRIQGNRCWCGQYTLKTAIDRFPFRHTKKACPPATPATGRDEMGRFAGSGTGDRL